MRTRPMAAKTPPDMDGSSSPGGFLGGISFGAVVTEHFKTDGM